MLRFNLHVPNAPAAFNGEQLKVSLLADSKEYDLENLYPDINNPAIFQPNPNWPTIHLNKGNGRNEIAYGTQGFETFQLDVPDALRGKTAKVKFLRFPIECS